MIGRAAAASAAVVAGTLVGPDTVFAGPGGEAVFRARIGRRPLVEPKRAFELVGVEARDLRGIELRARGLSGRWSEWLPVHAGDNHGPDRTHGTGGSAGAGAGGSSGAGGSAGARLSDPVWVGPSDAVELRARHSLRGARLLLVDPGRPATAAANRYVTTNLPAGPGQPPIIARSSWATSSCRPRVPAVFGTVELAFVHHTVSSNAYGPSQSAAMVRSICLFHKYGNGWNDIGYNFVVDRYGQIFEARAGGIDEAIQGAQAGGYNAFSSGVALLGTFSYSGPPRKTFNALSQLLAWKLALHGIELPGNVVVQVTRDGAPYSRYRAGAHVRLNRISGHRDADTTSCPGNGMYRQLPRLRQVVQRKLGDVTSLTIQPQPATPGNVPVGGVLTNGAGPIAGATIEIQQHSTTRPPVTLATATTNPDGTWAANVPLANNAQLRALFPAGDGIHSAAVSLNLPATVPPQVNLSAALQQTIPGGTIDFSGSTVPRKPKVSLVISQQQPDGTLTTQRTIKVNTNTDGTFTRTIGFPNPGQYQVVASTAADATNAGGTSAPVPITVA